jgi:hypothetical protein
MLEVLPFHEPERGQPCPRVGRWTLNVHLKNFQRSTSTATGSEALITSSCLGMAGRRGTFSISSGRGNLHPVVNKLARIAWLSLRASPEGVTTVVVDGAGINANWMNRTVKELVASCRSEEPLLSRAPLNLPRVFVQPRNAANLK